MPFGLNRGRVDRVWWILLGILAINALLKWQFFSGLTQADDFSYGVYSYSFFRIPLTWDMNVDFRALRLAMLLPVALLFRILPPTEFVAVLYPMLASFGTIVLVFLITRKVAGATAGLIAAFAMATFPLDVIQGTMLLPDVLAPFFLALAVWAFLKAESGSSARSRWWYLAVGIAVFLAFNTRENSYYFMLFFLPFAFRKERWKRGFWLIGAGFAAAVVLLYSVYAIKSGDFLYNLHLAQNQRDPLIQSGYIPANHLNWLTCFHYMFPMLVALPDRGLEYISGFFGYTFVAGVPFLIYTAVKGWRNGDRGLLIAPWWFLIGYLFIEFGSVSFTSYQMMAKLPRFLLTITPAMAVGYGVFLADVLGYARKLRSKPVAVADGKKRKAPGKEPNRALGWAGVGAVAAGMGVVLFFSILLIWVQHNSLDTNMQRYRWGYQVLEDLPRKPVYNTGGWWNNKLSFYFLPDIRFADMGWRRSGMLRDVKTVSDPAELADSYVIIERNETHSPIVFRYDTAGPWVMVPPKEWKLLGMDYHTEIYEVPPGWTWTGPEGEELTYETFLSSLRLDDVVLFMYTIHPDFLRKITPEEIINLFENMKLENEREQVLEFMTYRMLDGKPKIYFDVFE